MIPDSIQSRVSRSESPVAKGEKQRWWRKFAVQGVFWRRVIDWVVLKLPAFFHRPVIWLSAFIFFFIAAPARNAILRHLELVLPGSFRLTNCLRTFRVFVNFGWSLADSAVYRLLKASFDYELEGENFLEQLASTKGAIVLTAHMGNYELGAALFVEKFKRHIRMVRAPEPDALSAQHVDLSLQQSGSGAVKVGYSSDGTGLAFDLLKALRENEIISIQGDRVVGQVARSGVKLFGRGIVLPTGPFVLSLVSGTPIFPLFIVRIGYRRYKIIARTPIVCSRGDQSRDKQIAEAMSRWAKTLEETVSEHWQQWFAFAPLF